MENDTPRRMPNVPPFVKFVCANVPMVFDDSLSYYEALCALWKYIQGMTDVINNNATLEEEYIAKFDELKKFVDEYFDNLDVQEEINNKLDAMAEDGTLAALIFNALQPNVTWTFDTVADMQASENLVNGGYARTLGYYSVNDGGGAEYIITDTEPSTDFYEELSGSLYAKLIIKDNTIYTKQTGAVGDGVTDDTTKIQKILTLIKNNYADKFTVIVNGFHFVQPSLELRGTSDSRITNVTIKGSDATRDYADFDGIKDGFIFNADGHTAVAGFNSTFGFSIIYTTGLVIENLKITSTEEVSRGDVPMNNIVGLRLYEARGNKLCNCNITGFYIGCWQYNGGISYINNNNFAFCNIGYRTSYTGDSTFDSNYFNTSGFSVYNDDGTVKSKYSELYSNNLLYGFACYFADGGNITMKGGKIEWNNFGIWQDYGTNMIYDDIHFDRCTLGGITFTGHNRPNINSKVVNCNFTGCGGLLPTGAAVERHIGGFAGACIAAANVYGLLISDNNFTGDNGRLTGAFKTSGVYYGPLYALKFEKVYQTSFINNIVQIDQQYAYNLVNCEICYDNNICNRAWYMNPNCVVYRQAGIKREIFHDQPSTITDGNFDANDMIYSQNALVTGWRVSTAGSAQTINTSVSVVTVATDYYPDDGSVINLGTTLPNGVRVGAYVNIAGVTGTKKIIGVILNSGKFYAKLDTACDVAVLNATMTNQAPAFLSLS